MEKRTLASDFNDAMRQLQQREYTDSMSHKYWDISMYLTPRGELTLNKKLSKMENVELALHEMQELKMSRLRRRTINKCEHLYQDQIPNPEPRATERKIVPVASTEGSN